jgi:hypothetical protein
MMRPLVRPLVRPLIRELARGRRRWVYNKDGVDDFGVLASPIILEGDYTLEVTVQSDDWAGTGGRRIMGTADTSLANRGFMRYSSESSGNTRWQFIPDFSTSLALNLPFTPINGQEYRLLITRVGVVGTITELNSGATASNNAFNHPAGVITHIGRHLGNFFRGVVRDVKFNGVTWRIDQPQQAIQLPEPSGLGVELITPHVLANPFSKSDAWTHLGFGRWQLVGNGTYEFLRFLGSPPQPILVEFEVESISGGSLRVNPFGLSGVVASGDGIVSTAGIKRVLFNNLNSLALDFVRHVAGQNVTCIIKNISFKPLGTCNPLTLVNTNPERWSEIEEAN